MGPLRRGDDRSTVPLRRSRRENKGDGRRACYASRVHSPGPTVMTETFTFRADALTAAVHAIVAAAGSSDGEAAQVAANLVEANLRGHDSHGVGMVPRYVDAVLEGGLAVNAHVQIAPGQRRAADARRRPGLRPGHRPGGDGARRRAGEGARRLRRRPGAFASPRPDRPLGRAVHRRTAWSRSTSSTCCRGRSSRRSAAATRASAPTRSASASRARAASRSCSTSRPARSPRARRGSPTTRASRSSPER